MKKISINNCIVSLFTFMAAAVLWPLHLQAHPYASGITNDAGTIRFILNEAADNVKVVFNNNVFTNNLGALPQGKNSFSLGSYTNYSIIVTKSGSGTVSQISVDATNNFFFGPRGVAVNQNPKSRFFGRIYVCNASAGTLAGPTNSFTGRGVYVLNADTSDTGRGTNAALTTALGSSTTYGPYRPFVGPDDMVYVGDASGLGTTAGEPVWMCDPEMTTSNKLFVSGGAATNNQAGPCVSKPFATGSYAAGTLTLYAVMWATNPPGVFNNIRKYNIGGGTLPWTTAPTLLGNVGLPANNGIECDIDIAPDGKIFATKYRANNTEITMKVFDTDGVTLLWDSLTANNGGTFDSIGFSRGVAVSPDGKYVATVANPSTSYIYLIKLTNGIPDISTLTTNATGIGTTARGPAFDAADNVYVVSGGSDRLRAYSLGLTTTCTTKNDGTANNGTFAMAIPDTTVSVTATTPYASQSGPTPGVFTLTRAGQELTQPVTVRFKLTGTATNGVYTCDPAGITPAATNIITFAANETTTNITIIPDTTPIPRLTNTVILSVMGSNTYTAGTPASDTVYIQNTATPVLSITNLDDQMYERINDFIRFKITRLGDATTDLTGAINVTYGGTAVNGTDYNGALVVDMAAGDVSSTFKVTPIHNGTVTGPLTVSATLGSGSGYTPGTPATTGTSTIVDSDMVPETVVWADNLSADTSANWTQFFATTNGAPDDYTVNWAYDYSAQLAPSAPHSVGGDTHGLYMTVNKNDALAAAAALNFYPNGQSFSGNYAFRFDMYLIQNDTSGQTEYALFGINHSGTKTNWFRNSTTGFAGVDPVSWDFDGIFFDIEADGAALGDYVGYSSPTTANRNPTPINAGRSASTLKGVFKSPPWTPGSVGGGAAANVYGSTTPIWADVEISQINGVITWKINQTTILSYVNSTNVSPYTSGDVMLGYCDAYDSIGSSGASVIYANARVISLTSPVTTQITSDSSNVAIKFSANAADVVSQFVLQSASAVDGPYSDVSSSITALGGGNFNATRTLNGPVQFYRIRRLY